MTATPYLRSKVEDHVGWLMVDRPANRGAMNRAMWEAMPAVLTDLAATEGVRIVVIRGTEGNFIAGADISEFTELRSNPELARRYDRGSTATLQTLATLSVPSLAMIEGACVGGGCLIALGCDLRVAAEDARMAIPAGKLGLAYPYDGLERLVAVAGEAVSLDLLLTGRFVRGKEAATLGLVQRTVPQAELEKTTRELAASIAANAPLALRYARLAVRRHSRGILSEDERLRMIAECFQSEDYQEGVRAFLGKRRPVFRGR